METARGFNYIVKNWTRGCSPGSSNRVVSGSRLNASSQSVAYSILFPIYYASIISRRYYWDFDSSSLGPDCYYGRWRSGHRTRKKWRFLNYIGSNLFHLYILFFNFCGQITAVRSNTRRSSFRSGSKPDPSFFQNINTLHDARNCIILRDSFPRVI